MDQEWHTYCTRPSIELLAKLEEILSSGGVNISLYFGCLHTEVAEILHRITPGRYGLMDRWGVHAKLFRWVPVGQCDDFMMASVQPERPDCLKVPFYDEGAYPHDFLIWDSPFHANQLQRMLARPSYQHPATILLINEATKTELPNTYEWEFFPGYVVGKSRSPKPLSEDTIEYFDSLVARLQKHFPANDEP